MVLVKTDLFLSFFFTQFLFVANVWITNSSQYYVFNYAFLMFNFMTFPIGGLPVTFWEPFVFRLSKDLGFVIMDLLLVIYHVV